MKNMKLNEAEMASIYGGDKVVYVSYLCSATCTCYHGQTEAKVAYAENMFKSDRDWGR